MTKNHCKTVERGEIITMLTQSEINFYVGNSKNIIKKDSNRRILCTLRYDGANKVYTIERKTPKTIWKESTPNYERACRIYYNFLYKSGKDLENQVRFGGLANV